MEIIENGRFDAEREFYGRSGITVRDSVFDGPADGESAFKECGNVEVERCLFNLRYPFWHDNGLAIGDCELTDKCRAAIWYSEGVRIHDSKLHGIKAVRECADVDIAGCSIVSPEFGWSTRGCRMRDTAVEGEYFMMRSRNLVFRNVTLNGKYSFQYVEGGVFENCHFRTKDAFWHARNVTVRNSVIEGEYLAWYCEDVTFENCTIIGTQPLCYCKGLKLINCRMLNCDLAFERSDVMATITTPVVSIKNPLSGSITVPAVGEVIRDIDGALGAVKVTGSCPACA